MTVRSRLTTRFGHARRSASAVAMVSMVFLLAGCGATPASNSITQPTPVLALLTVKGNLVFTAPGQTSQLSAVLGDGSPATDVTWTSSQTGVVNVTSSGLATAIGFGNAAIHASSPTAAGTFSAVVTSTTPTQATLTQCQSLSTGSYVLGSDLGTGTTSCLNVQGGAQIQLDCKGHTISGLTFAGVLSASIANCVVPSQVVVGASSANVTMTNMTFNGSLLISVSSNVTISNSSARPRVGENLGTITVHSGNNVQLVNDTIVGAFSAATYFNDGANNQVRQCHIDGAYDGGRNEDGTDDGVLLINETGDTVQGNTITNFFDTAVEGVDLVANTTIADNTVSNLGATAFGSYWCTNWSNNVIRNNDITGSPTMVFVYYAQGLGQCGATALPPAFTGNQVVGNRYRAPIAGTVGTLYSVSGSVPGTGPAARLIVRMVTGPVSGNVIQGNDFGGNDGPLLLPLQGYATSGNSCGPLNAALSNVSCGG